MKRDYRNCEADAWYREICREPARLPFFFTYRQRRYHGFPEDALVLASESVGREEGKETCEKVFTLEDTLRITLKLTHYFTHGATEWTVWFENTSKENSGVLEDIQTELILDGARPVLKGILGDHVNQYRPYAVDLQGSSVTFSSDFGRATHVNFPYFNLEYGNGGVMLAIGWAGTWTASFSNEGDRTVYAASAVNGMRTYLKPGERIRTALFLVAPYTVRNEHYATNYWRDFFMTHNLPKADAEGNDLRPFSTCNLASDTGLPHSDGSISECYTTWRPTMEKMLAEDVKVDFRWLDAGWYVAPDLTGAIPFAPGHDWGDTVGTWELDPVKWPGNTFRESTDFARSVGMKTIAWFEPERVNDPENLVKNFGYRDEWAIRIPGESISNNIGDPDCFDWTAKRICRMLRENRVELYREDNNCNAISLWKYADALEGDRREGITECKLIDAHYRMWDTFVECTLNHGGCGFVDSCASGGGRNDLESMRRGVPILRSDSDRTTTALRLSMTTAFNRWIPFCGANTKEKKEQLSLTGVSDPYVWRASYLPILNVDSQFTQDPHQDFDMLRFGLKEWKRVSPYMLKEFYLLTPWRSGGEMTDFTSYCFYDPETESGVLLAFRQEQCAQDTLTVSLPFAETGDTYVLTDEDTGETVTVERRLSLPMPTIRSAKLLWMKKI